MKTILKILGCIISINVVGGVTYLVLNNIKKKKEMDNITMEILNNNPSNRFKEFNDKNSFELKYINFNDFKEAMNNEETFTLKESE